MSFEPETLVMHGHWGTGIVLDSAHNVTTVKFLNKHGVKTIWTRELAQAFRITTDELSEDDRKFLEELKVKW